MPTVTTWEGMPIRLPEGLDARKMSGRILRATERLSCEAFRMKKGILYAAEVVGTLQVGQVRINVLPKLDAAVEASDKEFLINLLSAGGAMKRPHAGPAAVRTALGEPMEVVIGHAARTILSGLSLGPPRRYELVREEAIAVRGKLDMPRLVMRAGQAKPQLPVRHSPLLLDNELARCIKGIALLLYSAARTEACRRILRSVLGKLVSVKSRAVQLSHLRALNLSSMEERWREVVELASLLLAGNAPNPTFSGEHQAFGLLFPPQHLFERALRSVITEACAPLQIEVSSKGHSKYLYKDVVSGKGIVQMKPDYLLSANGLNVAVADAKWKRLSSSGRAHGVARDDLYQVAAYQSRYDVCRALVFYPSAANGVSGLIDRYRTSDHRESVYVFGVDIQRLVSPRRVVRSQAIASLSKDLDRAMSMGD